MLLTDTGKIVNKCSRMHNAFMVEILNTNQIFTITIYPSTSVGKIEAASTQQAYWEIIGHTMVNWAPNFQMLVISLAPLIVSRIQGQSKYGDSIGPWLKSGLDRGRNPKRDKTDRIEGFR